MPFCCKGHFNELMWVIIDSTDPVDFARGLFERLFQGRYVAFERGHDGAQTESPFQNRFVARCWLGAEMALKRCFGVGCGPTYPGTLDLWIGSKKFDPRMQKRPRHRGLNL